MEPNPFFQQASVVRAFIAGPSDVARERGDALHVIRAWNAAHSWDKAVVIEPVSSDAHVQAEFGGHPQDLINRQTLDHCHLLIAVFWSRLGTPTRTDVSGTAQEIHEFIAKGGEQFAMLFFGKNAHPHDADSQNLEDLRKFKDSVRDKCVYMEFTNDFSTILRQQLDLAMNRLERLYKVQTPAPVPELTPKQSLIYYLRKTAGYFQFKLARYEATSDMRQAQKLCRLTVEKLTKIYADYHTAIPSMSLMTLGNITRAIKSSAASPLIGYQQFWSSVKVATADLQELADHLEAL
jgi:hypothetical protein